MMDLNTFDTLIRDFDPELAEQVMETVEGAGLDERQAVVYLGACIAALLPNRDDADHLMDAVYALADAFQAELSSGVH